MTMLATPQPAVRHNRPVPIVKADRLRHLDDAPDTAAEFQRAHSDADLAVLVLDSALDLRCATPAAERLFRIGDRDLGHSLADLANPLTGIDLLAEATHALATGQPFSRELVNRSGARYRCRILPCRDLHNRVNRLVITCSDITEHRRAEQELIAQSEAAVQASRDKSRLLAAASHNLRQSMQVLTGVSALLERQAGSGDAARKLLARMRTTVESMSGTLNAFLGIDRFEAGAPPQLYEFPVDALFDRLDIEFGHYAAAQELAWRVVPCRLVVRSDPALLSEMLRNLLANAIRYTEQGKVLLGARRSGDRLRIEVWDTGIGIPEDELPRLFDEYRRGLRPGREAGFGLGLAIVHRLGQLLDHPVTVRSTPGKGSVFTVEVPLAVVAQPQRRPSSDAKYRGRGGT